MALVEVVTKNDPRKVIKDMRDGAAKAHLHAIKKSLAHIKRHHTRNEWLPGGGGKNSKSPHPTKLRVRSGTLKKSYSIKIIAKALEGRYGSDLKYAPVHEFGSPMQNIKARPGVKRTMDATGNAIEQIFAKSLKKAGL